MNKKLMKGSLAGVAALALVAGGGTFAAWSDWDSLTGSHAGADELTLVLNEPNSQNFDNMHLAPGVGGDYEFVVASRQGDTIPEAKLSMALTNLVGHEDGCTSTNSEADADPNCADTTSEGEFMDEARIIVNASTPSSDPDACNSSAHPRGARQSSISLRELRDNTASLPVDIGTLEPGQYVCVSMGLNMPVDASNASQGDSADFDLKFLLEQVV
jgi:predicted ribosomally synthesized peptide with SipW-like signal peptide